MTRFCFLCMAGPFWGLFAVSLSGQEFRTWTSQDGAKIQAKMIGVDADKVIVQRADKKSFIFPVTLLSPLDQAYVRIMKPRFTRSANPSPSSSSGNVSSPRALPIWSPASKDEWWRRHKDSAAWRQQAPLILESLKAIWMDNEMRSSREGRDFFNWFGHWRWLDLFLRGRLEEAGEKHLQGFVEIGKNETTRDVFLRALHPKDNQPRALELFVHLQVNHPDLVSEFPQLAAAFAVVFDQPFPKKWPHPQVLKNDLPRERIVLPSRFAALANAAKAHSLEYDPAKLSVTELKFVIDHLMPESELKWARQNVSLRRSSFEKAFKSIQYAKSRLAEGVFTWPNGPYTLAAIRERGGICVDQAYFSAMSGKAKGIPTLTFVGQGTGGGHAWFGFLQSSGRWETDCGRYESQNYPVGNAIDPQTWEMITDDELDALSRGEKNLTGFRAKSVDYFEWARANPEESFHRESLQRARKLHPGFVEVWKSEAAWVEKNEKDPRERRNFWNEWINAFTRSVDLKIQGQKKLAEAFEAMGNPREAEKIRALVVSQNRSKRFDLGILAGAELLLEFLEAEDWEGAEKQYQRLVRDFEKTAGGELFYKLVRPYVQTLIEAGQKVRARSAIDFLKKRDVLDLGPTSIISREMRSLETQLGG